METFIPRGKVVGPILPQFILETPLTFGAKIMYALLCNYASEKDHCWPSQATLAAKLSCSLSSVKNYLAELTGEKLIAIRRGHACCVYYLLRPTCIKEAAKSASLQPGTQPKADPDQPKFGYINNLNKQEEKENPPLPPAQTEPVKSPPASGQRFVGGGDSFSHDFEKAWDAYPKKEAVGLARSAWIHLRRNGQLPPLEKLLASIDRFKATESWQREQSRFVPQMVNWLRGKRWLDAAVQLPAEEKEPQKKSGSPRLGAGTSGTRDQEQRGKQTVEATL